MGAHTWRRGLSSAGALLLTAAAGCAVTVQPWSKTGAPAAPATSPPAAGPTAEPPGTGPYPPGILPTSALRPQGPNITPPNPYGNLPPPNVNTDSMVQLIKQLNETEDNRRVLLDQVQTLKKSLKERDENVRLASFEIEESSKQIKRTREDFRQWHGEMEELRERIRKLEESRAALRPLIEDILRQLERDRESFKLTVPVQPPR